MADAWSHGLDAVAAASGLCLRGPASTRGPSCRPALAPWHAQHAALHMGASGGALLPPDLLDTDAAAAAVAATAAAAVTLAPRNGRAARVPLACARPRVLAHNPRVSPVLALAPLSFSAQAAHRHIHSTPLRLSHLSLISASASLPFPVALSTASRLVPSFCVPSHGRIVGCAGRVGSELHFRTEQQMRWLRCEHSDLFVPREVLEEHIREELVEEITTREMVRAPLPRIHVRPRAHACARGSAASSAEGQQPRCL